MATSIIDEGRQQVEKRQLVQFLRDGFNRATHGNYTLPDLEALSLASLRELQRFLRDIESNGANRAGTPWKRP